MAFPNELILAIAGLALLGTIGNGLASALLEERHRETALITFLVTASGVSLLGIGAAFWGMLAGALSMVLLHAQPALLTARHLRGQRAAKLDRNME
jgi:benzoate membrane transport protein